MKGRKKGIKREGILIERCPKTRELLVLREKVNIFRHTGGGRENAFSALASLEKPKSLDPGGGKKGDFPTNRQRKKGRGDGRGDGKGGIHDEDRSQRKTGLPLLLEKKK